MKRKAKIGMIGLALLLAMVTVFLKVGGGQPIPQPWQANRVTSEMNTGAKPWVLLRSSGAADGTATYSLSTEDMSWGTKVNGQTTLAATPGMIDVLTTLGWGTNEVEIAFFSSDTDVADDDFDISVYAWKDSPYGPGVPVFLTAGDSCKVGGMACKVHPTLGTAQAAGLWCDTISGTDCWDGVTVIDSGSNRLCRLKFDLRGYRYVLVRVWNDGGATAAEKIGAIITEY